METEEEKISQTGREILQSYNQQFCIFFLRGGQIINVLRNLESYNDGLIKMPS